MDGVVLDLLDEAREAGLRISMDGDQLKIRGPKSRATTAEALRARKPEVLALLHDERERAIQERMDTFRPLVPLTGPIPFLAMTPSIAPGACLSCGDSLASGDRLRCDLCADAARRVIAEVDAERRLLRGNI